MMAILIRHSCVNSFKFWKIEWHLLHPFLLSSPQINKTSSEIPNNQWNIEEILKNKSTFGTCSTPWPASISVQGWRWMTFCELNWPNDLEGQGQCLPFSIPAARILRCIFGESSSNPLKVIGRTSQNSQNSESKWPKWPWRSRSMTSIFNTSLKYPRMHVWCKFGDCSPNLRWVMTQTSRISYNSESKWPKWPWSSWSMTSIFNNSQEYPRMHVWCKFGDCIPNQWRVIVWTTESIPWCIFGDSSSNLWRVIMRTR